MDRYEKKKTVYTAHSKHYFFAKMLISTYVLNQDYIPLNPFNNWAYFMDDMVERDLVVRANNNLIMVSDELWSFGPIADGCLAEIELAMKLNLKLRFFNVGKKSTDIFEINEDNLLFEEDALVSRTKEDIINSIKEYNSNVYKVM